MPRASAADSDAGEPARSASRHARATRPACRGAAPRARATRRGRPASRAARAQLAAALHALPRLVRVLHDRGIRPNRRSISSAAHSTGPAGRAAGPQGVGGGEQMADVIGGVLDLRLGQRALRPVGEPLGVVELDADGLVEHPLQRERAAEPGEARGELDVEHVRRTEPKWSAKPVRSAAGACITTSTSGSASQRPDRLPATAALDAGRSPPRRSSGRDLREAQPRRVGALPDELGVECEAAPRTGWSASRSPPGRLALRDPTRSRRSGSSVTVAPVQTAPPPGTGPRVIYAATHARLGNLDRDSGRGAGGRGDDDLVLHALLRHRGRRSAQCSRRSAPP